MKLGAIHPSLRRAMKNDRPNLISDFAIDDHSRLTGLNRWCGLVRRSWLRPTGFQDCCDVLFGEQHPVSDDPTRTNLAGELPEVSG